MTKSELRKKAKIILADKGNDYIKQADAKICENVLSSEIFRKSKTIFVYINTDTEPGTDEIIKKALSHGKTVCVPKCISKTEMLAIRIYGTECLKEGRFGIMEPDNTDNQIDKCSIDLAIIPCLAASYTGERLGHGAGYYDRFLENSHAYKICLCFKELIFDSIITDKYDIIMDSIITEDEI